ncbi:hypothetical protein LCGC14_1540410 [marine sediment metagenome]|uniref:Uncharacterized protein n=1 Tax=marine sediment metagenome TaxID=412755 RepID=A0A0F9LU12_9ZZZZ
MNYSIKPTGLKYTITIISASELQKNRIEKLVKLLKQCENINENIENLMSDKKEFESRNGILTERTRDGS